MDVVVVNFHEHEYYDIKLDEHVITFIATTSKGSYFMEMVDNGARSRRQARKEFKDATIGLIQAGDPPCELTFDDYASSGQPN